MGNLIFKIVAVIVLACAMLSPVAYVAGLKGVGDILFYCGSVTAIIMSAVVIVEVTMDN